MSFTIPNLPASPTAMQTAQSEVYAADLAVITAIAAASGVVSGCAVTASGTLTLAVTSGIIRSLGVYQSVAAGNATVTTADATNPRIDVVVATSAGALAVRAGTAAAAPVMATLSAGDVALAQAYVPATATALTSANLIGKGVALAPLNVTGATYNVREYGAVGDGVTDDAAAIQRCINASTLGSQIVFPPATYLIGTTLTLLEGRAYRGLSGPVNNSFGTTAIIKQKAATNLVALAASDAWLATQTVLAAAITTTIATSAVVTSNSTAAYGATGALYIDTEYLTYSAKSATTFTVARGQSSTTAATHALGATVHMATVPSGAVAATGNITATGGSIAAFPASGTIAIGTEIIDYTSIVGTTFTGCTRGAHATTAATHLATDPIWLWGDGGQPLIVENLLFDGNMSAQTATTANGAVLATGDITVTSTTGFPASGTALIDLEWVAYTSIVGNVLTGCTRGAYGSTAATHLTGVGVYPMTHGLVVANFDSLVTHNYIQNVRGVGILLSSNTQWDAPFTNTCVQIRVEKNELASTQSYGIRGRDTGGKLSDGFCIENIVGASTDVGISLQRAAGWQVRGNHVYGALYSAIELTNGWNTVVAHNQIDGYGQGSVSDGAFPSAILALSIDGGSSTLPGRGVTIAHNVVGTTEPRTTANYQGIATTGNGSSAGTFATLEGNHVTVEGATHGATDYAYIAAIRGGVTQLHTVTWIGNSYAGATNESFIQSSAFLTVLAKVAGKLTIGSGRGRGGFLVVAASNASQASLDSADYVCAATSAQTTINAALAILTNGGTVLLTEGTYSITAPILVQNDGTTLEGTYAADAAGTGTRITAATGLTVGQAMVLVQRATNDRPVAGATVRNLVLDGNSIAGGVDGLRFRSYQGRVENVYILNCSGNGASVAQYGPQINLLSVAGTATAGTLTLSYGGVATATIPWNGTALQVEAALNTLAGVTAGYGGGVVAVGGPLPAHPVSIQGIGVVKTTLSTAITTTATQTITVASTTGFPASGTLLIDSEQMTYSSLTGTTFVVNARGVNGTTAVTHAVSANIYNATSPVIGTNSLTGTSPVPSVALDTPAQANWNTYETVLSRLHVYNSGMDGIMQGGTDCLMDLCVTQNNALNGLRLLGASAQVVAIHTYSNTGNGILLHGSARQKIVGCKIEDNNGGIYLTDNFTSGTTDALIQGNAFASNDRAHSNTYDNLQVNSTTNNREHDYVAIMGNHFDNYSGQCRWHISTNTHIYGLTLVGNTAPSAATSGIVSLGAPITSATTVQRVIEGNNGFVDQLWVGPTTIAVTTGSTITPSADIHRLNPGAAVTGVILSKTGAVDGQEVRLINISAFLVTFAAQATSFVADGTSDTIPTLTAANYLFDATSALWYRQK